MDLSSNLGILGSTNLLIVLVAFAGVVGFVALGVITQFFVSGHRERVARHESIGAYYGRELALTH